MTEQTQASTANPHTRPEGVDRDRVLSARWDVDTPDSEGFQLKAQLNVTYHKGHGYRAVLTRTEVKQEGPLISEKFSFDTPQVLISTQGAARFSRKKLGEVYGAALAEMRAQFDRGVPGVVAVFTSPAVDTDA